MFNVRIIDRPESGPRLRPIKVAGPRGRRLVEVLLLALRLIRFTFLGPVRRVARSRCRLLQLVVRRTNSLEHEVGPILVFRRARGLAVGVPLERLLPISLLELRRRTARRLQSEKFVGPPRRLGSFRCLNRVEDEETLRAYTSEECEKNAGTPSGRLDTHSTVDPGKEKNQEKKIECTGP